MTLLHFHGKILTISKVLRFILEKLKSCISYIQYKPLFKEYHYSDIIKNPIQITPEYIELGENVTIWYHGRILGVSKYNDITFNPSIILHDGVKIQQNIHLTCANSIEIGDNTAIAANVTITDINHPYTNINIPIERQNLEVSPVKIGKDCKIYNNVVILPGTIIGNHVTIGANSVVLGTIPDNCVAVGMPARIVKKYDYSSGLWKKTDKGGNFI